MRNQRTLADLITDALAEGPQSGHELARCLEHRHELPMRGREGSLYAALIELERKGYVESRWEDLPEGGRRRRYLLPVLVGVDAEVVAHGEEE